MRKAEFLEQLRRGLCGLPQEDMEDRLTFYGEMIEDRMEEGLSEEEAVSAVGAVDEIVKQVIADTPFAKIAKERIRVKRRLKAWEIVLLALGFPIWISLAISAVAIVFSLYVSLWSVIVSLWSVFGSMVACSFGGVVAGIVFVCRGDVLHGLAMLAAGSVCAGLSIFAFYGCKAGTRGILVLTKNMAIWIKNGFIRKEEA